MLKAVAQHPAAAFLLFFLAVAAPGAVVVGLAVIMRKLGRPRLAAWTLVAFGLLFVVGGVLLFAPQPLWVGGLLIALGFARHPGFRPRVTRDRS